VKFEEPKSKTGKPMLGMTIAYYANNRASSRWFLNELSAQNMTYSEAAKAVGFKIGTIRKYCHRYSITLKPSADPRDEVVTIPPDFYSKQINKHNALSRKWSQS
jgi:hypothetical protein